MQQFFYFIIIFIITFLVILVFTWRNKTPISVASPIISGDQMMKILPGLTCKLLTSGGFNFVCLPNGIRIPLQSATIIRQDYLNRGFALVTFSAISDKRMNRPVIEVGEKGSVSFSGTTMHYIEKAIILPIDNETENEECEITLWCAMVDTIEQPIPYIHKAN